MFYTSIEKDIRTITMPTAQFSNAPSHGVEEYPLEDTQPVQTLPFDGHPTPPRPRRKRTCLGCSCGCTLPLLGLLAILAIYLLAGGQTKILILGIDSRDPESNLGRSDTNILLGARSVPPRMSMLSIPRDLWVVVPGYGENRINTAHFFAEGEQPGNGPKAAIETVETNFNIPVDYFIRIRFAGLTAVVDALGGLEVDLPRPMSGYPEGKVVMNGEQALAFVRDRQGSDDFFRMERGQLFIQASFRWALSPANWPSIPAVARELPNFVDTDIPVWLWPRLGLVFLIVGPQGIDNRVITRDMVQPFTTEGGAAVLAPDWSQINPVVQELFGE